MLYNIHINQLAFSQFPNLDYRHAILFDALHKIFTTFTKIEKLNDWYWLSYSIIQEQLPLFQVGKDQLRNLLKDLATCQLIEINPDNQRLNKTYFKLGTKAEMIFKPLENIPDPYGKNSTPPLENIPDNNNKDYNYQKETKKEKKFNAETYILDLQIDLDVKNKIIDWLEIRKAKKTPTTEKSISLALALLNKNSKQNQIKILETSILNGWVGIFPLKENGFNNQTQPTTNNYNQVSKFQALEETREAFDKRIDILEEERGERFKRVYTEPNKPLPFPKPEFRNI
jgi:hypothetical protein